MNNFLQLFLCSLTHFLLPFLFRSATLLYFPIFLHLFHSSLFRNFIPCVFTICSCDNIRAQFLFPSKVLLTPSGIPFHLSIQELDALCSVTETYSLLQSLLISCRLCFVNPCHCTTNACTTVFCVLNCRYMLTPKRCLACFYAGASLQKNSPCFIMCVSYRTQTKP